MVHTYTGAVIRLLIEPPVVFFVVLIASAVYFQGMMGQQAVPSSSIALAVLFSSTAWFYSIIRLGWAAYRQQQIKAHAIALHNYISQNSLPATLAIEMTPMFELFTSTAKWSQVVDQTYLMGFSDQDKIYTYLEFTYGIERSIRNFTYTDRRYYYSIVQIDLGREMPHLFFDSSETYGQQTRKFFHKDQVDKLEYGFERYFTMYFPEHYRIDARSIISPEVMEALLAVKHCDVEIYGRKLYLYTPLVSLENIPSLVGSGLAIRQSMMDHSQYYRDAHHTTTPTERQSIAAIGSKLAARSVFPWFYFLLSCFLFGFGAYFAFLTLRGSILISSAVDVIETILGLLVFLGGGGVTIVHLIYSWYKDNASYRQLLRANREYGSQSQTKS